MKRVAEWAFDAIGTRWRIDAELSDGPLDEAVAALIDRYDRDWSRFRDDSRVRRIARAAGRHELPAEGAALLDLYRRLHDATDGAVSPLVGAALEHHGYDAAYSLRPRAGGPGPVPPLSAIRWSGTTLETDAPLLLDVGALGKGQLVDLVGALLVERGAAAFTIDAGGDLLHRGAPGRPPLRVALEHPGDPSRAIGVAELDEGALAASAVNRRAWGDRHHVLDGRDGEPTRWVAATWAIAATAMEADGLATALFFRSPAELAGDFAFEGLRVLADGRLQRSPGWPGELF